jgi:hypothetical protein
LSRTLANEPSAPRGRYESPEPSEWHRDPWVWVAAVFSGLVHSAVFFSGRYLPYIDWSNHIALIAALGHGEGNGSLAYLERSFAPGPYLLFYATAALLSQGMPVEVAAKLCLVVTSVALPLSAAYLASACGRSPRLAIAAPLAMFGISLGYGFASFVFGLPMLFALLGSAEHTLNRYRSSQATSCAGWMAAWLLLTYLGHGLLFLFGGGIIAIRAMLFAGLSRSFRPLGIIALAALPTTLLALANVLLRSTSPGAAPDESEAWLTFARFADVSTRLPGDLLDRGSSGHRWTMWGILAVWIVNLVASFWNRDAMRPIRANRFGLEVYAAGATLFFLFGPESINWPASVWLVRPRFGVVAGLLAFLLPTVRLERPRWTLVLATASLVLVVQNAWLNADHIRKFSQWAEPYNAVRAAIPPRASVLAISLPDAGDPMRAHPALGSLYFYHMADGAAYCGFLFNQALLPIHQRPDFRLRTPDWRNPSAFRPETFGRDYDYLVLRGTAVVNRTRDSRFHQEEANLNGWVVFRRRHPEGDDPEP